MVVGIYIAYIGIYNAYFAAGDDLEALIPNSVLAILGTAMSGFGFHGAFYSSAKAASGVSAAAAAIFGGPKKDWQPRAPSGGRR